MSQTNRLVAKTLTSIVLKLEDKLGADVLAVFSPIDHPLSVSVRDAVENLAAELPTNKRDKIAVVLETDGGYIESAQRIVDTLRHHYKSVDFFIPSHAMSAGTVLVMSGDSIWMDYYSVLGPIDPQVLKSGSGFLPASGYLLQYEKLIKKSAAGTITKAELALLLQKFDLAELYRYEQAKNLSISLLKEWLAKYKFKDWTEKETTKVPVDEPMRVARAEDIANQLSDTDLWLSHGRGISMDVLINRLNLKIEDFGSDGGLKKLIRRYQETLADFVERNSHEGVIQTRNRFRTI